MKTSSEVKIQPYEPSPRQLAENLWVWDGEWEGTSFRRRMTIVRLQSGGLFIHSAIRLQEKDYAKLDQLGRVEVIVVPNHFHDSDAPYYKQQYPQAKLYVSKPVAEKMKKLCTVEGTLPDADSPPWKNEISCLEFQGTRMLSETVFFHKASRTLILTDLVFNMRNEVKGAEKIFFKINGIYDRFGPSRIFRWFIVNSVEKAKESLREMMKWNFDRVIMNHGEILDKGGRQALQQGFKEIGLD